jgi:type I restriction enzyme S subunit
MDKNRNCTLGSAVTFKYGKSLPDRARSAGTVRVYGSNGPVGTHLESLTHGPTIVVGRKGSIGEVHYSDSPCWPIDTTYYVDDFRDNEPLYLYWWLKFLDLGRLDRSTAIPGLNRDDAYKLPLFLPARDEQRRILASITYSFSRSDIAQAELNRVPRLVKNYKRAVLAAAFRGDLTRAWRESNSDLAGSDEFCKSRAEIATDRLTRAGLGRDERSALIGRDQDLAHVLDSIGESNDIPPTWTWCGVGEVFEVYVGATPSRREPAYWKGDVPWVSSGEVAFCRINRTDESISQAGLRNTSTRLHPSGTVLLGMIGEGKTRGQTAILDIEACNNQNCAAIRVSEAGYSPEYVYWYFYAAYEQTRTAGGGNNQPALNKDRVQRLSIPIAPPQESTQVAQAIEAYLKPISRLEAELLSIQKLVGHLNHSILEKAFDDGSLEG